MASGPESNTGQIGGRLSPLYHPWWLRSRERILFTSFLSPAGFTMSRGYWLQRLGHFRLWPPSWTGRHTWPRSHAGIDPMPDKMNLDYIKLLNCEFQKHEFMTMSVVGGHANPSYKATKHTEGTFLISDYNWYRRFLIPFWNDVFHSASNVLWGGLHHVGGCCKRLLTMRSTPYCAPT